MFSPGRKNRSGIQVDANVLEYLDLGEREIRAPDLLRTYLAFP